MKILRPIYSAAGIFFPIGKPEKGGTCQYASDVCLKKCYAQDKDYDEVLNIPEEDKKKIYDFFVNESLVTICNEIIKEMGELQVKILTWFASGDCLDKDIDKIYRIMFLLHGKGVIQNGFTRNVKLYDTIIADKVINHIVLTVESKAIKDAPGKYPKGLWAIPNYETGVVDLYHGKLGFKSYGDCGMNEVTFKGEEVVIASNCSGCYSKKIGCFLCLLKVRNGDECKGCKERFKCFTIK